MDGLLMSTVTIDNATEVPAGAIFAAVNDRKTFSESALASLAASIAAHGLAQYPTVRPVGEGFEIVAGERRIRAMRDVLGWQTIPVIVREYDDEQASAIMLAENLHRADLDAIEEAEAYQSRMDKFGSSVADVAELANVSQNLIRSRVALLALCDQAKHLVSIKQLPLNYAALMVGLDTDRQRLALAAYAEKVLTIDSFRALCSRLLDEQNQESMFDPAAFFQLEEYVTEALETVAKSATLVDEMATADPVGQKDIAQRLGVKHETVATWKYRGLLPEPRWTVSDMPVWEWSDILDWYQGRKSTKAGHNA